MSATSIPLLPSLPTNAEPEREQLLAGYVFVHVPRTAGSSIWQSIVRLAAEYEIRVFDIYRESNHRYGFPEASDRVLEASQKELSDSRFLYHHHTAENIFRHFDPSRSVFATVLRDPIDRFVSDVYHYRRFVRSTEPDSPFASHTARFWSPRFTSSLRRDDIEPCELLDLAMAENFFRNYYVNFFAAMCRSERDAGGALDISVKYKSRDLADLAREIRQHFRIIGDFSNLQETYSQIQAVFRIPPPRQRLELKVNRGESKPRLTRFQQRRYVKAFASDYCLLDELQNLSPFQKSFRRVWRAIAGFGTIRRAA
jgi:hypothetical protein